MRIDAYNYRHSTIIYLFSPSNLKIESFLYSIIILCFFFFFFFFQAEDGIRDYKVTGVQTCALPIFTQSLPDLILGVSLYVNGGLAKFTSNQARSKSRFTKRILKRSRQSRGSRF